MVVVSGWVHARAKNFLTYKQVKLTSTGPLGMFFEVGPTPQSVVKRQDGSWACSCEHFAIHTKETCSHIIAAKHWLRGDDLREE